MTGKTDFWIKAGAALLGLVCALAAVAFGFSLSQAWLSETPPERVEVALTVPAYLPPTAKPAKAAATTSAPAVARARLPQTATMLPTAHKALASADSAPPQAVQQGKRPAIAIVIDDLGADLVGTRRTMALPKAVTMAFLPYPDKTPELSHDAFSAGHEILLHMPMAPKSARFDPGPNALHVDMPKEEVQRRVLWALSRVPQAIGLNNHEGSWFTSDHKALIPVMDILAQKHLFFLDSRTTAQSKGVKLARAANVPVAGRDVFIDDTVSADAIARQLGMIETVAQRKGIAIAIGHPHRQTLAALEAWIPAVEKQGYELIPLSEAIRRRNAASLASAAQ